MNSDNSKEGIKKRDELIVFFVGLVGQIIVFVLSNYISSLYSTTLNQALIISIIIISIGFICWFVVRTIIHNLKKSEYKGLREGLLRVKEETQKVICCPNNDSVLCLLNVGINDYDFVSKNDETISIEDRLYGKDHVYGIEKNESWDEIWIFSEDLSSEIDPFTKKAEPILVRNITVNRTKYTIFYSNIDSQRSEIESRKKALKDSLSANDKRLLSFVPIDVSRGYIGKNTLPLLCGSILFCPDKRRGQLPVFSEGYLSIRKKYNDIPIYYKMPKCMLREYSKYFKDIKNKLKKEVNHE